MRSNIIAASLIIAADIAPIQNLSVLNYIRAQHKQDDTGAKQWAAHWISQGFEALERIAESHETAYLMTNAPSLFECCLVPQSYNARRFGVDMDRFPKLKSIDAKCRELPAFIKAAPENQADAKLS